MNQWLMFERIATCMGGWVNSSSFSDVIEATTQPYEAEAVTHETEARTHEAEAMIETHEARGQVYEAAEVWKTETYAYVAT